MGLLDQLRLAWRQKAGADTRRQASSEGGQGAHSSRGDGSTPRSQAGSQQRKPVKSDALSTAGAKTDVPPARRSDLRTESGPKPEQAAPTVGAYAFGASGPLASPAPPAAAQVSPGPAAAGAQDEELDRAFEAIMDDGSTPGAEAPSAFDPGLEQPGVHELFADIAANHARPIKDFILDLERGVATKEWIAVCRQVMVPLIKGADATGLPLVTKRMIDFDEALGLASGASGTGIDAAAKDLILSSYREMAEAFPQAFGPEQSALRRDSMIIQSLLRQIPDVGHVTFQRLYGAGLNTLDALFLASKDDLSVTTGIPPLLSERICERVQEHRRQLDRRRAQSGPQESSERLEKLVDELRRLHEAFERASREEWANPALAEKKRELRRERQVCGLQIDVELADIGKLELAEQLQKMSFGQRIEILEQFVGSMTVAVAEA